MLLLPVLAFELALRRCVPLVRRRRGGGLCGGGLGLASNGRMSPLPADEPHFDVVEAISEAGSADAALLAPIGVLLLLARAFSKLHRELLQRLAAPAAARAVSSIDVLFAAAPRAPADAAAAATPEARA